MDGFMSFAKVVGNATVAAAKSGAKATQEYYDNLGEMPTSTKCDKCKVSIPIPQDMFDWVCPTETCEGKIAHTVKACPTCEALKPEKIHFIECATCNTPNNVYETNGLQILGDAKTDMNNTIATTQETIKKEYAELQAVPDHIPCVHCTLELGVPQELFNWTCAACNHVHDHTLTTETVCAECKVARAPENNEPPQIRCPKCEGITVVPYSNARKHLAKAATTTKNAYNSTTRRMSTEYKRLSSAPKDFNCKNCNELLNVEVDAEGNLPPLANCPKCNQATAVPKTVFQNSVNVNVNQVRQITAKAFYDISGSPYITCDVCKTPVKLPKVEEGDEVPAHHSVTCKCGKVFERK